MTLAFEKFMKQYRMTGSEKADGYSSDAFVGLEESEKEVFVQLMSSADKRIRAKAAYYAPSDMPLPELISGLEKMIRMETDTLASINATNKLLECYGVTRDSLKKEEFSHFYRALRSGDSNDKEKIFDQLRRLCEPAS